MSNTCRKQTGNDVENTRQISTSKKTDKIEGIDRVDNTIVLIYLIHPIHLYLLKFYMKPIKNLLVNIIINGAVLYAIVYYVPELGFKIQTIYKDTYIIFGILGIVFWLINSVLKSILKILTLPVRIITLWLSSLLLNIIVLYIFEQTVNYLDIGITVHLGTLVQTLILSVILSAIYFIIKKII